jgi:HAD superfamily hydrolase (TIGR01509 family)
LVKLQGELYEDEFIERAQAFPQVRELFETLKAHGVAVGIATTCKKEDLAVYDRQLRALELVDAISCGDTVKHGKPDPALFTDCLERLKLEDASSAIAIGDTPFDALAAKAAKMRSVGVLTGGFAADALLNAGCEEVFDRVERVLRVWYTEGAVTVGGGSP